MYDRKGIVVTAYGHDRKIDKISVSLISDSYGGDSDAEIYCGTINKLELKDEAWVFAKIISANTPYTLDSFLPFKFSELVMKLESRSLQKVLLEVDRDELAKALIIEGDDVRSKVFENMTKRASQMLKEDMERIGQIGLSESKKTQDKINSIIRRLINCGEILSPFRDESQ